jgi:cysteine desulfurase
MPKPVAGLNVDAIIFSSHKFGGAKGHGAVLMRSDGPLISMWKPLIPGSQQNGMRGGTLNVMGVASAAAALEDVMEGVEKKHESMKLAIMRLVEEFKKREMPRIKILAPLDGKAYVMNTMLISLPFCSRVFAKRLSEKGYDVGTGSACQTNVVVHTSEQHPYQIRISLSLSCGSSLDVSAFVNIFSDVYEETRKRWKEKLENEMDLLDTDEGEK